MDNFFTGFITLLIFAWLLFIGVDKLRKPVYLIKYNINFSELDIKFNSRVIGVLQILSAIFIVLVIIMIKT